MTAGRTQFLYNLERVENNENQRMRMYFIASLVGRGSLSMRVSSPW